MRIKVLQLLCLMFLLCGSAAEASEGIGWIPTWKQAQEQAAKTGKPILLMAAAPQCGGVPGMW